MRADLIDERIKIDILDGVFKYKLNEKVSANVFEDIWQDGEIFMRECTDYDKHDDPTVTIHYKIIIKGKIYCIHESKIKRIKNDK